MAVDSILEDEEENILYDLLINTEWPPETDTQQRGCKEQDSSLIAKAITGPFRFILHYLWYSPSSSSLPPGLVRLANKQINWQLVLASNGKLLAVVQDQCVEIRSVRDDFASVIGKCQVPKDPHPQWRRVAWSHDCGLLAYADSSGTVRLYDLMGSELFIIPPAVSFPGDFSYAAAGLLFLESTASAQWSAELLVITYSGQLKSYLVSVGTNQAFQESHSFNFSTHYTNGITTAIYHPGHRLLLVGGCESHDDGVSRATRSGLTAWRLLSGQPHYKQVTSYEDDVGLGQRRGFFRIPSFKLFSRHSNEMDGVFRMSVSPDGALLAVVHFSGRLSLWDVPSFKHRATWEQNQQPGFDDINPEWKTSLEKRKKIKDKEQYGSLMDVSWWNDAALILARCSGSLTVSSIRTLRNLLGKSCEWFEPSPRVTPAYDGGFLSLECEVKMATKRSRLESSTTSSSAAAATGSPGALGSLRLATDDDNGGVGGVEAGDESDSDEESWARARYFGGYVKQGLYYVTEMERFAPPRKRPRAVLKNYRLLSLRSTTPEELYQRKIDNEEYGEALSLAHAYGLDSDLVYQRQWRRSTVSIASIQDYLSKIKKRSWVLHECVERVPENVDAAKELLQYGLKGTDLDALIAIGNGQDGGRFILPGDLDLDDAPYEDFLSAEEEMERRLEKERSKRQELLQKVDFSRLTLEQKELCRSRLKLLCYLDRLATYEEILGGPHAAEERYDAEIFKTFRSQNIVQSARNYARKSDVQALDILFTYHGSELLQHRLAILCNFPETTSPHEYTILLPEASIDEHGNLVCIPWDERRHRETDWCEETECRSVLEANPPDDDHFLYEEEAGLERFRTADPPITLLTDWYLTRAQDIDRNSRQVDCALSLVRLGKEREIPGLERLCDDLVTLETLVYETSSDLSLSLQELLQLRDIDKLRLLMKNCTEQRYVKNCFQWMVPFLQRCESQVGARTTSGGGLGGGAKEGLAASLLREYLVSLANEDLTLPFKVFQSSKPDCHQKIMADPDQLMRVALDCIYSCQRDDQLPLCYDILECLPQRGYGPETSATRDLHDQVDMLEKHLSVAEVLEKHGLKKPISFVKKSQNSEQEAHELMVKLTRHVGRRTVPVSENEWKNLLGDMLDIQKSVYTCLKPDTCQEIFTESLLCSSRLETVALAAQMMHCSSLSQDTPVSVSQRQRSAGRVAYGRSVELVLAAAREYFNSSATLTDPCMSLARSCLQLITDCPPVVAEELDLINALSCLEDFDVKILPLQVRLREDRLSLIKECVAQTPSAYRQATTLLDLARLLRVAGDDTARRKGQVLTLLAEQALGHEDYKASYCHCQELMTTGYGGGWEVCAKLAECDSFGDIAARHKLMAFALTHCPPANLQNLLVASSNLETTALYQAVNYQKAPLQPEEDLDLTPDPDQPQQSADLLHRTTVRTMKVLSQTGETTRAVLSAVTDKQWWRDSLNYLRPMQGHGMSSGDLSANQNADLERQACHPFYESLFENPYVHPSEDVYTRYDYSPHEDFAEVLLRTGKLQETQSEENQLFPASEVLLQLASDAFPQDMTLALAYLLALPQVLDANRCFAQQPVSVMSLQLASFYYSLHIYSRLAPCFKDSNHPLYRADPKELIGLVTRHVSEQETADWPAEVSVLIGQLQVYSERLADLTQAQVLKALGRGVDTQRFSSDIDYKKHTILGLAETLEDSVYAISISLAQRYNVPLWEVHMTHLEYLFTDSGLSTNDIEGRCECLGLLSSLKTNPQDLYAHMLKYVYPAIAGSDLNRLLLYYSLLESCDCSQYIATALKPDTHIKLLKKLKAVANGLDYRKLTDESCYPLAALEPVLSGQNVLSISKLLARVPLGSGSLLTPSAVHLVWLRRVFWQGDAHVLKKPPPQTDVEFLHAYDTCAKYLDRLLPADAAHFLDSITFSPEAANQLSVESRCEMTKRALKWMRAAADKSKKKGGDDTDGPASFEPALSHMNQSLAHLETLSQDFHLSLKGSDDERLRSYSRLYDLSRSEVEKVHQLAVTMAMDGQPLQYLQQLLEGAVGDAQPSVETIVQDAVERIIAAFSGDEDVLKHYPDPLKVLEAIVSSVQNHMEDGGGLVSADDVLAWLRPFCGGDGGGYGGGDDDVKCEEEEAGPMERSGRVRVEDRIAVLKVLEQAFNLNDEDVRLLVFFRSQAVLKAGWPQRELEMKDIVDEQTRLSLFLDLLSSSNQWEEFQHIMLLLRAWPPVTGGNMSDPDCNPWVRLTSSLLTQSPLRSEFTDIGNEVLTMCRTLYSTKHSLPPQCIGRVSTLLLDQSMFLPALKLMAESRDEQLLSQVLDQLKTVSKVDDSTCDSELLSILLSAGLLLGSVTTPYYPRLASHLLSHQHQHNHQEAGWDVEAAARELSQAGHSAEAGSLLLAYRGAHPGQTTFGAAVAVLRQWL